MQKPSRKKEDGVIVCSTYKGLKPENEDRYKFGCIGSWKVLLIADGVTQSVYGGEAAQIVVNAFYRTIEQTHELRKRMSTEIMKKAYEEAVKRLKEAALEKLGKEEGFETTIIAVIEAENSFFITYLGDGRIYLVRGDLWQGAQLMVTHRNESDRLGGALAAYGLVGEPVYIEHSKSFASGEIIIAGTDGTFELKGGNKETVTQVLAKLRGENVLSNDTLQEALNLLLKGLAEQGLLYDDATLGVIITEKAEKRLAGKDLWAQQ